MKRTHEQTIKECGHEMKAGEESASDGVCKLKMK